MKKHFLFSLILACVCLKASAQITNDSPENSAKYIQTIEQSLQLFYEEYAGRSDYDSIINALNYEPEAIPEFDDSVYCQRLSVMNEMSPFHLDCNPEVLATIRFFAAKRRSFTRIVLGRSKLYFDMFEEKLSQYGLPIELKYLAVIESGLRPQVKSRAGALGLWQFMYRTGLMYGLEENSYIDERMDPERATEAACQYLKKLYEIYGDWNLALAAYNAGPGNVNKAIRRSNGKTTYWEVRPYLPRETQGYVPNFIAAAYLLTYHAEHNIIPMDASVHRAQLDTMCLSSGIHMSTITRLTDWDLEEIQALNPIYKTTYVPSTEPKQCIYGPLQEIGKLVSLEDSLYTLETAIYNPGSASSTAPVAVNQQEEQSDNQTLIKTDAQGVNTIYHKVSSGESLGKIAEMYDVSVAQIMDWNNLRSTKVYVGQQLKVETTKVPAPEVEEKPEPKPQPQVTKKYYTVRSGDTFSRIAERHGLSQSHLRRLNPGININRLSVGQRIRVK